MHCYLGLENFTSVTLTWGCRQQGVSTSCPRFRNFYSFFSRVFRKNNRTWEFSSSPSKQSAVELIPLRSLMLGFPFHRTLVSPPMLARILPDTSSVLSGGKRNIGAGGSVGSLGKRGTGESRLTGTIPRKEKKTIPKAPSYFMHASTDSACRAV